VIEDERLIRETIMETLELANLQTIGVANGLMDIHLALQHLPDLIISAGGQATSRGCALEIGSPILWLRRVQKRLA